MEIILIGNYLPDKQESMERFTKMLESGFQKAGIITTIWRPRSVFGSFFSSTTSGIGKWMGYFDKWILFPLVLVFQILKIKNRSEVRFHICDHSNAPYLKYLPSDTLITCHDVLAIKGAMGYAEAYCPATPAGKILQKWILNNLSNSKKLAAVSNYTLRQLNEIDINKTLTKEWSVILNGFNAPFYPMSPVKYVQILLKAGLNPGSKFLLHVGSGLPRKNRKLLIDMLNILKKDWDGVICYAGQELDEELKDYAISFGLIDRIVNVVNPPHETLVALYSCCEAFIFPSFSEGFGWPIIEAQACGAPVIASALDPMPEVSGGAAIHANPNDPYQFVKAFSSLSNDIVRSEVIEKGFKNSERFNPEKMISSYINLHNSI